MNTVRKASRRRLRSSRIQWEIQKYEVLLTEVIPKIDTTKLTTDDSGMDDMDQDMSYSDTGMTGESSQNAFITILSTGAYRIKGTVNEMIE